MIWNYRILQHEAPDMSTYFGIHECYYDNAKDQIPKNWTAEPIDPYGNSVDDLYKDFKYMERAFTKPVLEVGVDGETLKAIPNSKTPMMTVWENLIIRNCKKNNPSVAIMRRILSRRAQVSVEFIDHRLVLEFLLDVIKKFKLDPRNEYAFMCHPSKRGWSGCNTYGLDDYYELHIGAACSLIGMSQHDQLPGYRIPTILQRRYKKG